jgi:hypothetical protein
MSVLRVFLLDKGIKGFVKQKSGSTKCGETKTGLLDVVSTFYIH